MAATGWRTPVAVGLAALMLAWACVSELGLPFVASDVEPCGQTVYETESWGYDVQAWPPGATTCVIDRRDGSTDRITVTTWRGPATLLLFAASASVLTLAVIEREPRMGIVGACVWLASAAVALDVTGFVTG